MSNQNLRTIGSKTFVLASNGKRGEVWKPVELVKCSNCPNERYVLAYRVKKLKTGLCRTCFRKGVHSERQVVQRQCKCGSTFNLNLKRYKRKHADLCPKCAVALYKPILQQANFKHGFRTGGKREPLYVKWQQMMRSCYKLRSKDFSRVGAIGIKVHEEWHHYEIFREWALSKHYREGKSMLRRDVDKDFTPDNIVFVQGRANKLYEYNGMKYTFLELRKALGSTISPELARSRMTGKGWDVIRALTQPIGTKIFKYEEKKERLNGRQKTKIINRVQNRSGTNGYDHESPTGKVVLVNHTRQR